MDIVNYPADGGPRSHSEVEGATDGATFTCPPLGLGQRFAVRVFLGAAGPVRFSAPLAPASTGPFVTDRAELHFDLRLEAWSELPVRVLEADGTPVAGASVSLLRIDAAGEGDSLDAEKYGLETDADGRTVAERCASGRHRLTVTRQGGALLAQEVMVSPGSNPEVVVRLPER